ncbi:MAG: T9SS type A sorting domain-containing protein, partial [Bacteroidota bacterium]
AVYEPAAGDSCNNIGGLTEIACLFFQGNSSLGFPADSGSTYYIQVSNSAFFGGGNPAPFCLTISEIPPLTNDMPCQATLIPTDGSISLHSNIGATVDPGEANLVPANAWAEPNVDGTSWLKFAVPQSGAFNIDLCQTGTGFDTQIALFSAGDCNDYTTFTFIAGDEDGSGFCALGNQFASQLESCQNPGDTVYVMVDGFQGETGVFEVSIIEVTPQPLSASLSASPPDCPGSNTGRISLTPSGGLGQIQYQWSNGDTAQNIENLAPGTYSVIVSDNCGSYQDTIVVGDAPALVVDAGLNQTFCPGDTIFLGSNPTALGGKIFGGASKGFGHIQGQFGADFFSQPLLDPNAGANINTLVGNLNAADFTPSGLLIVNDGTEQLQRIDTTSGASTNIGSMVPINGYDWSGLAYNAQNDTLYAISTNGLNGRLHYVNPADGSFANGPFLTTVQQPLWLAIGPDGSAYTLDAVTDSIFSLDLNTGETQSLAATPSPYNPTVGLDADVWDTDGNVYFFTEVDPSGFQNAELLQFDPVLNTVNTIGTLNLAGAPRAWAVASSNEEPYQFEWIPGNQVNDPSLANPYSLPQGAASFIVRVEDACGTVVQDAVNLSPSFEISITDGSSGQATVNVTGGQAPISILWSTGDTTASLTAPSSGVYGVTVTDASGCSQTDSVEIWATKIGSFGEAGIQSLNLYPNPANKMLVVELDFKQPERYSISLISAEGRRLWQRQYEQSPSSYDVIATDKLAAGMYLLQIHTERGVYSQNVLVQH